MHWNRLRFLPGGLLLGGWLLVSCTAPEDQPPDGLIPKERMADILTEIHIAEARVSRLSLRSPDSSNVAYKHLENRIFQKFQVDTVVYRKSYGFYSSHPREMEGIYQQVTEKLKKTIEVKKTSPMTIGIIGAGISGLTLAYELQQRGLRYHLWEAANEPGGYIRSRGQEPGSKASYLCELGPNSLLGDADLLRWLDELGLTPELAFSRAVSKVRYIFRDGQYRSLPSGPLSLILGSFFSWSTKWAIFRERHNQTVSPPGETLAQFFRRRFTDELVDYALGPFVAGIYAGDPEQLLVSETFPVLLQYEKEHGSVLRGLIKNQSVIGRRQSFSFRAGLQMLPNALAAKLTHLSLNESVTRINQLDDQWHVSTATGTTAVDRLVLAVGADVAARLVEPHSADFANALRQVEYPPMTVVHSAYKRADVQHPLNGFGGLNPKVEGRFAAGHIWSSSLFEGRCPDDEVLFTTFIGGQNSFENARQSDGIIFRRVHQELTDGFGISASEPVFKTLYRWERAIPQYDVNIRVVRRLVESVQADDLYCCANWYGGVSLSDCIGKARALADELAAKALINNF